MALTGNKGEWSEIYTLFKLLGDGKVHAGDADMNKLELYYPILNLFEKRVNDTSTNQIPSKTLL